MVNIDIADAAGDYDFKALDMGIPSDYSHLSYSKNMTGLTIGKTSSDHIVLEGVFKIGSQPSDIIKSVTSLAQYSGSTLEYTATGLDITSADVESKSTLQTYLDGKSYNINGNDSDNSITSADLADKLYGMGGNDILKGLGGNDLLDGGKGKDTMEGGDGNDTYHVDSSGDSIVEARNEGTDSAYVSISYNFTKTLNLENIYLTGSANLSVVGNASNNEIHGNSGNNTLAGGDGNDVLTGGGGVDTFVFMRDGGIEEITDFAARGSGHDNLDVSSLGSNLNFSDFHFVKDGNDVDVFLGKTEVAHIDHVAVKDITSADFSF
jgi:Ca2+-binding RTX toxin-like protein